MPEVGAMTVTTCSPTRGHVKLAADVTFDKLDRHVCCGVWAQLITDADINLFLPPTKELMDCLGSSLIGRAVGSL